MLEANPRPRGRPRAFDEARALDGAITLFSTAGFSAAAIDDLTKATGLTVGSLYKAYKDKRGIFARALDRYVALREAHVASALAGAENGRDRIVRLLGLYAELSQGNTGRLGCMVVAGIAELDGVGDAASALRATLGRRRAMLATVVAEGQRDGSIPATNDPGHVADLLLMLLQGMRVVGKAGHFPTDVDAFLRLALKILD